MFATTAQPKVSSHNEDAAAVGGVVQHEVGDGRTVGSIAPIAEEVLAKALLVGGL